MFEKKLHLPVAIVDRSDRMLAALKGVVDAEEKRKIIGAAFIQAFEEFKESIQYTIGIKPKYLVQVNIFFIN